jgi:LPXTG-site transpeptidase (sortase) family protein
MFRRFLLPGLERMLLLAGILLMAAAGVRLLAYNAFQADPRLFGQLLNLRNGAALKQIGFNSAPSFETVWLQIPRLHVDVAVLEGVDDKTLGLGAGHLPGSAAIGSMGNAVIAGHRDTAFRALQNIRAGDRIDIVSAGQRYSYDVKGTRIVDPSDVSVLARSDKAVLTIITCYPFYVLGSAPQRFIVQAEKGRQFAP